ncbi:uncharacterized protein BT62DRAFT_1005429 [Guyanagaster necrorhizus]|uniref:Uncharacterized protein n=1 Tax=Guyanagaster necrorhizus TaxID=856835 RepID=A0A9P7VV53_9AGAR|nr:uncharacterized protein BT62DRAFT_1005429 [Guyanagaster necrorhizus MCA 3950]KAG7447030.1 hypothetical protein BT62DRAFT_1005429 [Guyanagaster necrorhizus MCA 3950]
MVFQFCMRYAPIPASTSRGMDYLAVTPFLWVLLSPVSFPVAIFPPPTPDAVSAKPYTNIVDMVCTNLSRRRYRRAMLSTHRRTPDNSSLRPSTGSYVLNVELATEHRIIQCSLFHKSLLAPHSSSPPRRFYASSLKRRVLSLRFACPLNDASYNHIDVCMFSLAQHLSVYSLRMVEYRRLSHLLRQF